MSISVSQNFQDAWAQKYGKVGSTRIRYKRRYKSGAAYVYESAWQILERSDFKSVGSFNRRLDFPFLNTVRSSNCALYLNNVDYRWLPNNNTGGVFQADDTAPDGYEPRLTEFQVQIGYELLTDGSLEYATIFDGFAVDYLFDSHEGAVEVQVVGRETRLDADAQEVNTAFTQEATSPATGNGTNKEFVTTSLGVGRITQVRINGVAQTQGTDYKLSNLNVAGEAATITFTTAPGAGLAVDATGIKWKANQLIETLVGLLCDEAGIASADRTINPVIFPGLSGSKTIDSQAQWEAGTVLTNIGTTSNPGSIKRKWFLVDNFDDGDYTNDPTWTLSGGAAIVTGGKLRLGSAAASNISTAARDSTGAWDFKLYILAALLGAEFRFAVKSWYGSSQAYSIYFAPGGGGEIRRINSGVPTTLATWSGTEVFAAETQCRVTRDAAGNITFTVGGSLKVAVVDTDFSAVNTSVQFIHNGGGAPGDYLQVDDFYLSDEADATGAISTAAAVFESAELDLLATPLAFGTLDRTETLNGGTIAYSTAVASVSGGPYDAYASIGASGQINSALKRYLKIKAAITPLSGSYASPEVDKLVANFTTSSVFLAMANFGGKDCFAAIERLAQIADYECGFEADGKFFFRSKTVSGSPAFTLDQENAISKIADARVGYDAMVNIGQVTYNGYVAVYAAADAGESSPTYADRYGTALRAEDISDLFFANDITMAQARARLLYENNRAPKRRGRLLCKMIPHVELSDIVQVSYFDNPLDNINVWGDPLQEWGFSPLGPAQNVLARDLRMKVIGISHDPDNWRTELEVQEVLS